MQYFTSQSRSEQAAEHSLRANQYRKKRRARRDEEEDEDEEEEDGDEVKTRSSSRIHSHAAFTSSETAQLRVAGLLPDEEYQVPPAPFPHAPESLSKSYHSSARVEEEMAKSPSRLYAVNAAVKGDSIHGRQNTNALKQTHLNVLSTIMHRCLLEGDYERAGRAWGMILRTQVAGGPVDPRNQGRWGIGAEILLHRKHPSATDQHEQSTATNAFSDQGFELAKEYYERLIVQHPNRKVHPHAVDERTFYPAMFSLWIFEVCEKSRRARKKAQDEAPRARSSSNASADSFLGDDANEFLRAEEETLQVEELTRAIEIADRLDQLILSPPFDKDASLFELRGNISLWISDLSFGTQATDEDWDIDPDIRNRDDNLESAMEKLTRLSSCHREVQKAKSFFERAVANGAQGHATTFSSIDIKLRELAQQLERLRAS
ncbi:uncharacterized protein K460DRAFT_368198 [Cucurbitaria berberidis CBS 394.84]|uniref:Uncharacterized protein n=1 Tax=Cucurbitaria berberidis CBS 394.84 TaxID=1168544 RepID=A0A9P4L5U5_9PLEO|nr:uncharacterized protein K460DRAFT_368198 [Cucurbitaria berberidis CBS 394.84]KAF1843306.1 hypothetical protein K460DRAFT_368198 [Cucurbitaria berberidis CBS 394.84]